MASGKPFERVTLTEEDEELLLAIDKSYEKGKYVTVNPPGVCLSKSNDLEKLQTLKLYEDDTFVITPPKCGTTWMQEIIWLMKNNVDLEAAKEMQFYRFPFVEIGLIGGTPEEPYPEELPKTKENVRTFMNHSFEYTERLVRPRFIKTHLPISLMPPKILDTCKVVFCARNVKDMAVSYYYHTCMFKPELKEQGFLNYAKLFRRGLQPHAPGITMMLEAWELRNHPNMFFTTYEEMKKDFDGTARRLMKFLNVKLSEEKFAQLKVATTAESFRNNDAVNKKPEMKTRETSEGSQFIRKATVGDWRNHFDEETSKEWDQWIEEALKGTDYKMDFNL